MKTLLAVLAMSLPLGASKLSAVIEHPSGWICPEGTQKAVCGGTYCCEPKLQEWLKVIAPAR